MKKTTKIILAVCLMLGLSACMGNSGNLTEGMTDATNTFNYVLVEEAGEYRLHKVRKWKDGNSDALGITTECCNNQFWTSYNRAILYTNKPTYLPDYVIICDESLESATS
jgi:hypothetical protein